MLDKVLSEIKAHKAKIGVIGLGYVGLPLALSFARKGFYVYGIDNDVDRVERLLASQSYITDVTDEEIAIPLRSGTFLPTTDFSFIRKCRAVIICVPTPIKRRYTPDISFMLSAIRSVATNLSRGTLIVLESTTYPGTTEEIIQPEIEKAGYRVGKDFYLAFSPERIDPGNATHTVTKIPKVIGGVTAACNQLAFELYSAIISHVHMVSSPKAAEMAKLLENTFRLINIAWINEAAMMCKNFNIDIWEVIEAAKTKPFGFMPFYPGLGVGGHCIPEDPIYLYWKARQRGYSSKFIKLSADINSGMPAYAVERIRAMLGAGRKTLAGAKILVLGVTYKKDVKDLRKSPSIKLIELLKKQKASVDFHDPFVPYLDIDGLKLDGLPLAPSLLKKYDCVVFAVDHSQFDRELILANSKLIFDIKNVFGSTVSKKVIKF